MADPAAFVRARVMDWPGLRQELADPGAHPVERGLRRVETLTQIAKDVRGQYTSPANNRYSYQLKGFDSDWIDAGAMHRAIIAVGQTIRAQATIMGYADAFGLLGAVLIIAIIPVALLRRGTASGGAGH